jgi:hypothetical protein
VIQALREREPGKRKFAEDQFVIAAIVIKDGKRKSPLRGFSH